MDSSPVNVNEAMVNVGDSLLLEFSANLPPIPDNSNFPLVTYIHSENNGIGMTEFMIVIFLFCTV